MQKILNNKSNDFKDIILNLAESNIQNNTIIYKSLTRKKTNTYKLNHYQRKKTQDKLKKNRLS